MTSSRLDENRRAELRERPELATTDEERLFVLNAKIGRLQTLANRIGNLRYAQLEKHEFSNTYKRNRGRPESARPDPFTALGTQLCAELGLRNADPRALLLDYDYARRVIQGYPSVTAVSTENVGARFVTTLKFSTGYEFIGNGAPTGALSAWAAFLPVYTRSQLERKEAVARRVREARRGARAGELGPGLSDRGQRRR